MIAVSYYTDERYRQASLRLSASLDRVGISYDIRAVADTGVHLQNRQFKATFIKQMAQLYAGQDVCWMDSDLTVVRDPVVLKNPPAGDVGLFRCGLEFWSPLVYIRATPGAHAFVNAWIQAHLDNPAESDRNLRFAVVASRNAGTTFFEWPETYLWYQPNFHLAFPGKVPVILHECLSQVS